MPTPVETELELKLLPENSPLRLPLLYKLVSTINSTERLKILNTWQHICRIAQLNNLKHDEAKAHINIGAHYFWASNWAETLAHFTKAVEIAEQISDTNLLAKVFVNKGAVYGEIGEHNEAIKIFERAFHLFNESGQAEAAFRCQINIAATLPHLGKTDESNNLLHSLLQTIQSRQDWSEQKYLEATVLRQFAKNYMDDNCLPQCYGYYKQAKTIFETSQANFSDASACVNGMANALLLMKDYRNAIDTLNLGSAEDESSVKHLAEKYRILAQCYEGLNEWQPALEAFKKFKINTDELKKEETGKKLLELEFRKEVSEKQKEIEIEHLRNVELKKERDRSETLLLNILPAEVAVELKEKGTADAKLFDEVTVLFTDFKSFTNVSEQFTPQQLVNELNECFKAFDEITGKYNIEKIKTVGDAYLAAAGLPSPNQSHAEDMINAALEMRDFMLSRREKLGNKTFEMRIGIHSGSVVAGIVGVKKFAYDIWGDTVNTAARMEQNGETGKVNISEETYKLVKQKYKTEYRGEIEAKNKGKLKMYFVDA